MRVAVSREAPPELLDELGLSLGGEARSAARDADEVDDQDVYRRVEIHRGGAAAAFCGRRRNNDIKTARSVWLMSSRHSGAVNFGALCGISPTEK